MKNFASTTALIAVCLLISSPTWAQSPKLGVRCKLGVLVLGVDAESPAQKAGIKALDYIVACDEQAVASFQDMRGWLDGVAGGETHAIRVSRGNEEVVTSVHFPKTASGDVVLGVSLNEGVMISGAEKGSPAAAAGLKAGDLLTGFNGETVTSLDDLRAALDRTKAGSSATVTVLRGRDTLEVPVRFGTPIGIDPATEDEHAHSHPHDLPNSVPAPSGHEHPDFPEGHMPPPGFDFGDDAPPFGLPGLESLEALGGIPQAQKDLDEAMTLLRELQANHPSVAAAMAKLESVQGQLKKLDEATRPMRSMTESFGQFFGPEGPDLGGNLPDLAKDIEKRVRELLGKNLELDKLQKKLAEEFPGIMIEIDEALSPAPKPVQPPKSK